MSHGGGILTTMFDHVKSLRSKLERLSAVLLPVLLLAAAVLPAGPAGGVAGTPDGALAGGSNPACPDPDRAAEQAAGRFTDVTEADSHAANIGCIAYYKITLGVGDGARYAPGQAVTRWQMALFLIRTADRAGISVPRPESSVFVDIGDKSAAVQSGINSAAALGLMSSTSSTASFSPDGAVTRGDMALFLVRLLELTTGAESGAPIWVEVDENGRVSLIRSGGERIDIDDSFPDTLTSATLEQEYAIEAMYELGVAAGKSDGNYDPKGRVTRAQMASFIIRTLGHTSVRPAGTVTLDPPPTTTTTTTTTVPATTTTTTTVPAAAAAPATTTTLPPDPDGVYTGDPLQLITHAEFARAYSLPGSTGDRFEVWLCNTPWIGYYSENLDHRHNPSNYAVKFASQVTPWFDWLSGGLYTPKFSPGGVVSVSPSFDYYRSCYSEVAGRYSGGQSDIEGVVIVVGVSAGESILGQADCGFYSQRSFPDNGRVVMVSGNAFTDPTVLAHEMGHGLCWPHSYSGETVYGGEVWEYDNPMDIMGWGSSRRSASLPGLGTSAVNRYAAGWIPPSQVAVHTPGTTARYTLEPIGSGGVQMLIVPYEADNRLYYRALGVRVRGEGDLRWADADLVAEGVEIYDIDQTVYGCDLPDRGYCHGLLRRMRPLFDRDDEYVPRDAAHVMQPEGRWYWQDGDDIEVISRSGDTFVVEVRPYIPPKYTAVAAGFSHSCGVRVDGGVVCWGGNESGQLDVPSGRFSAVAAGSSHSCGVRVDGDVVCWGDNSFGQLDVPSGRFSAVSASDYHSCGVRVDGGVVCWGNNRSGELDVPSGRFSAVAAGSSHSCGVRVDGDVVCWGSNYLGQLGVPSGRFSAVAASLGHSCGVRVDGGVICWGDNKYGELGVPSGRFSAVSVGWWFSCGVRVDGGVVCWGDNESGRLDVPSGRFSAVSAGDLHSCGVRVDGGVVCWGSNTYGQLDVPN